MSTPAWATRWLARYTFTFVTLCLAIIDLTLGFGELALLTQADRPMKWHGRMRLSTTPQLCQPTDGPHEHEPRLSVSGESLELSRQKRCVGECFLDSRERSKAKQSPSTSRSYRPAHRQPLHGSSPTGQRRGSLCFPRTVSKTPSYPALPTPQELPPRVPRAWATSW